MRSATILALTLGSFGILPLACTQDFNFFASTQGAGGHTTSSSSSSSTSSSTTSSTSSSTSSSSSGCAMDMDCSDGNNCTNDTCDQTTHKCSNDIVPDGPPPGYTDTMQDCKTQKCVGGMEQTVAADTDVPPSGNPCVTNSCSNQMVQTSDVSSGTSCGGGGQICDGMGKCVGCTKTSDCMNPGTCKSVACNNNTCDVSNVSAGTTCNAGGGKLCDGMGNCVGCLQNSDCSSGNCQMASHTCGLAANGHSCTNGNQCQTNHCVNGVCCDHTCNGTCQACTNALTGAADGTCADVKAGTPPVPASQCAASTCGNTGNCAAGHVCEQVTSGSNCGTGPTCMGNTFHGQQTCSNMTCGGGSTMDCGTYKCATSGCPTSCASSNDCFTGNYCMNPGATGTCVAQLADGTACTDGSQCTSTFCYGTPSKTCQSNSCADTVKDGNETDVDCGGGSFMGQMACPKCTTGQKCLAGSDCMSGMCIPGTKLCQ